MHTGSAKNHRYDGQKPFHNRSMVKMKIHIKSKVKKRSARKVDRRNVPQRIKIRQLRIVLQEDRRFEKEVWVWNYRKKKVEVMKNLSFQFLYFALQKRRTREGRCGSVGAERQWYKDRCGSGKVEM